MEISELPNVNPLGLCDKEGIIVFDNVFDCYNLVLTEFVTGHSRTTGEFLGKYWPNFSGKELEQLFRQHPTLRSFEFDEFAIAKRLLTGGVVSYSKELIEAMSNLCGTPFYTADFACVVETWMGVISSYCNYS